MGGRPETGFNSCLHECFKSLAQQLNCGSYWIDSACVPDDEILRREAIRYINSVFANASITLVCDRDLVDIDISDSDLSAAVPDQVTILRCEQILAAIVVCDWSIRAWTLLESVKGRRNLRILCKHDRVVSFEDVLRVVHQYGNIDLCVLALSSPQLFPPRSFTSKQIENRLLKEGDSTISIARGGTLLSYRPARRHEDELLIWSLLTKENDERYTDPLSFWNSRENTWIETGFLMSSAPRLDNAGFTWAPKTPNAARTGDKSFLRAYDGEETKQAKVTTDGLLGEWMCFQIDLLDDLSTPTTTLTSAWLSKLIRKPPGVKERDKYDFWDPSHSQTLKDEVRRIEHELLAGYKYGLLLTPVGDTHRAGVNDDISWALRPSTAKQAERHGASVQYRGFTRGFLVAVCGSNGDFRFDESADVNDLYSRHCHWPAWVWRGVWEMPEDVQLSTFREKRILIA